MISRKKEKNFDMFGIIFCYLQLRIGNLLQNYENIIVSGEQNHFILEIMGNLAGAEFLHVRAFFGLFLQNIYPW